MVDNDTRTIIDLKTTKTKKMTILEVIERVNQYRSTPSYMDYEFYIDWNDYTIKAELKKKE